jgi:hypothetical protein
LTILLFLLQHLEGDHLHRIFRGAHALVRFHLSDAKFNRAPAEIIDSDDEDRPAIGLQLTGRRSDKNERAFQHGRERYGSAMVA